MSSALNRPRQLVLTQGDPDGVGPELLCALAAESKLREGDRVVAARGPLDRVAAEVPHAWAKRGREVLERYLVHPKAEDAKRFGQVAALRHAVDLVLETSGGPQGRAKCALVTAPIDKKVAQAEGLTTPGHTEYLAQRAGSDDFAMAMLGPRLRVVLATIHLPLSEVPRRLDEVAIVRAGSLLLRALMSDFGMPHPRVALLGLNPHAGEGGLLGHEDESIVRPAAHILAQAFPEASISGPLPADTAFPLHARGHFDGIVAMYHDQGLCPFKLMHFDDGVNMTLGLPFVRTSPDHGTAKDIAFTGKVNPSSMFAAVAMARG